MVVLMILVALLRFGYQYHNNDNKGENILLTKLTHVFEHGVRTQRGRETLQRRYEQ